VEGSFVGCGFGEKKENLSRDDILLAVRPCVDRLQGMEQVGGGSDVCVEVSSEIERWRG
jgi:hypothetical protein